MNYKYSIYIYMYCISVYCYKQEENRSHVSFCPITSASITGPIRL